MQKNIFGIEEHPGEVWSDIEGGPYKVSSHGRVYSYHSSKLLFQGECSSTYLTLNLSRDRSALVHRLVMKYFGGPQPSDEHVVNHIDGDKHNNHIENLEWLEPDANRFHGLLLKMKREKSAGYVRSLLQRWTPGIIKGAGDGTRGRPRALSEEEVKKAVGLRRNGLSLNEIGDRLGASRTTVSRTISRYCEEKQITIESEDGRRRDFNSQQQRHA